MADACSALRSRMDFRPCDSRLRAAGGSAGPTCRRRRRPRGSGPGTASVTPGPSGVSKPGPAPQPAVVGKDATQARRKRDREAFAQVKLLEQQQEKRPGLRGEPRPVPFPTDPSKEPRPTPQGGRRSCSRPPPGARSRVLRPRGERAGLPVSLRTRPRGTAPLRARRPPWVPRPRRRPRGLDGGRGREPGRGALRTCVSTAEPPQSASSRPDGCVLSAGLAHGG